MRGPLEDKCIGPVSTFNAVSDAEAVRTRENVNSGHVSARRTFKDEKLTGQQEFIQLHVLTKNLQSIQDVNRYVDFIAELADLAECAFDIVFLTETWRTAPEETLTTPRGHGFYLGGGDSHCGVGIAVGKHVLKQLESVTFHVYFSRVCCLRFRLQAHWFQLIAC